MGNGRLTRPDLRGYRLRRSEVDATFEGVPVPGLLARFYHRNEGDGRTATVGRYWYGGRELLRAWGYAEEEHCRASAVRDRGGWYAPTPGCPSVRVLRVPDGGLVVGFAVRTPGGRWITRTATATVPSRVDTVAPVRSGPGGSAR